MKSKLIVIVLLIFQASITIRGSENIGYVQAWFDNIEKLYHSCVSTVTYYIGGPIHGIAQNLLDSYAEIGINLQRLNDHPSVTISSASRAILEINDMVANIKGSPLTFLKELNVVFGSMMTSFREIVWSLEGAIGELTVPVNEAIADLEISLRVIMETTLNAGVFMFGLAKKLSLDAINNNVQKLVTIISTIAQTAVSTDAINIDAEICALTIMLQTILMTVQGINVIVGGVLLQRLQTIPKTLQTLLTEVGGTVDALGQAITSLTLNISKGLTVIVSQLTSTLLNLSNHLTESLNLIFGAVNDIIPITENLQSGLSKISGALL